MGAGDPEFEKNRRDVVSRCIERGINYIDACWSNEVIAYSKALKGRRDKMYLGYSWGVNEVRFPEWRTFEKLKEGFRAGPEDGRPGVRRPVADHLPRAEQPARRRRRSRNSIKALDWAKKSGQARFTGISSHDRPHIKKLIEKYPQQLEVICTPYTAKTKVVTTRAACGRR